MVATGLDRIPFRNGTGLMGIGPQRINMNVETFNAHERITEE